MNFWAIICKSLGYIWLLLTSKMVLVNILTIWLRVKFIGIQDLVSLNCIAIYIATIITLAPGVGLLVLSNYFTKKIKRKSKNTADLSKHEEALNPMQKRQNGSVWEGK